MILLILNIRIKYTTITIAEFDEHIARTYLSAFAEISLKCKVIYFKYKSIDISQINSLIDDAGYNYCWNYYFNSAIYYDVRLKI